MKFFLNLTRSITVGERELSPLLTVDDDGLWRVAATDARVGPHLLEPFVTEHFSEAANPPLLDRVVRRRVHAAMHERRDAWLAFHGFTLEGAMSRSQRLELWHGERYGHAGLDGTIAVEE